MYDVLMMASIFTIAAVGKVYQGVRCQQQIKGIS